MFPNTVADWSGALPLEVAECGAFTHWTGGCSRGLLIRSYTLGHAVTLEIVLQLAAQSLWARGCVS